MFVVANIHHKRYYYTYITCSKTADALQLHVQLHTQSTYKHLLVCSSDILYMELMYSSCVLWRQEK